MTDRLDQFLDGAAKAARSRAEAGADDGAATRLRLRESIAAGSGRTSRSRKRLFTMIAAILGSLFGSFAFAAYVAGWNPLSPSSEEPSAAAPVVAVDSPAKPAHRAAPAPAPEMPAVALPARIEPDAAVVIEPPTPASIPELPAPPKTVVKPKPRPAPPKLESTPVAPSIEPTPSPTRVPEPPQPAPVPAPAKSDDDLADYRIAHEAHFRGHDAKAALVAWDAYLAKHGKSQLATDARYNRALALVKLARYADARAALAPFANAAAGSYRQAEAAKLLAALPAK
jgi:hypothetical protein